MSYSQKLINENTRNDLAKIAEDYGIDVGRKSKKEIVEEIVKFELGVPEETKVDADAIADVDKNVDVSNYVLVRFTGSNSGFQVGDFTFSRKNPFLAVPPEIAEHVYKTWPDKFRPASHIEVEDFYA